jgi:hypothetical protein
VKLKALSFRQPWANLIVEGRKTLDLRTWNTHFRGPLAVYASLDVEKDACALHGVDLKTLTTGALIGVVDLVDVIPLDEVTYTARATEHLNGRPWHDGLYGWVVKNPRLLDPPQVVKGRLNLFEVEIPTVDDRPQTVDDPLPSIVHHLSSESEFELRVVPEAEGRYKLGFAQRLVEKNQPVQYNPAAIKTRVEVELGGDSLRALADVILETLRQNGYKATDLSATRREPFHLDEASGVRLGLIFLAAKPLSKAGRIEQISQGVRVMTGEELFYWYSKCTNGAATERAQKALRVLLSEE